MTADAGQSAVAPESGAVLARAETERVASRDTVLRDRARRVIPGGMYGHQSAATWPAPFPQFLTQLVPVGGARGRRHRVCARADRSGVRCGPRPLRLGRLVKVYAAGVTR